MSLINDALKAAQQERGRSLTPAKPQPIGNLFPYPQREVKRRPNPLFIGAIAVTVVVVGASAIVWKQRSDAAKTTAQHQGVSQVNRAVPPVATNVGASTPIVSGTVVNPPAPAPQVVPKPAPPAIAPAPRTALSTPTAPAVRPPRQAVASVATPKRPDTTAATAPATATPAPPVTVQPSSPTTNAPIKLVLDPAGARPADSLSRLAYAEQLKNNLDGARDLYEKAIATKQAPAEAFNNYGVLLEQQGHRSMATEMFRQAIARDDKNVEAWVNLGDSFIAAGHHGSALSAFDRARQLDPTRPAIKVRLADEHLAIGDTAGAKRTLEDAVRSSPDDARSHYALGTLLQTLNDFRGAIREFDLFIEQAGKSNEFTADKLTEVRRHVASLRRVAP